MSAIKFAHIRPEGADNRQGGYTVAFRKNDTTGEVEYAVARCNAKDNFNKATGREIAKGRLENGNSDYFGTISTRAVKYASILEKLIPKINGWIALEIRNHAFSVKKNRKK